MSDLCDLSGGWGGWQGENQSVDDTGPAGVKH